MSVYTKNGKPIVKSENGVLKLVTGDCCCPCTTDRGCGLPHTIIQLGAFNINGEWRNPGTLTLTLLMKDDGMITTLGETEQTDTSTRGDYDWVETGWVPGQRDRWLVNCIQPKCDQFTKYSTLQFHSTNPEIDVYGTGYIFLTASQSPGNAVTSGTKLTSSIQITRSFKSKVPWNGVDYWSGGPNGNSFNIELDFQTHNQIYFQIANR